MRSNRNSTRQKWVAVIQLRFNVSFSEREDRSELSTCVIRTPQQSADWRSGYRHAWSTQHTPVTPRSSSGRFARRRCVHDRQINHKTPVKPLRQQRITVWTISASYRTTFYSSRATFRSEEEYMRTIYILRTDDRPTTDLPFWKISNGHISATDHPIRFIFGSRYRFSRSVDRVTLFEVLENPKWRTAAI